MKSILIAAWFAEKIGTVELICKGWWYWATDNKITREMASNRLAVCYGITMGEHTVKPGCHSRNGNRCGECGCVLKPAARVKEKECPLGKWPANEVV